MRKKYFNWNLYINTWVNVNGKLSLRLEEVSAIFVSNKKSKKPTEKITISTRTELPIRRRWTHNVIKCKNRKHELYLHQLHWLIGLCKYSFYSSLSDETFSRYESNDEYTLIHTQYWKFKLRCKRLNNKTDSKICCRAAEKQTVQYLQRTRVTDHSFYQIFFF